jgi:hypothetical protein
MNTFTPWAICIGVFIIYPCIAFAIGFYIGRRGVPFYLRLEKNPNFGKNGQGEYDVSVE